MDAFIPDNWILDAIPVAIWVGRVPDGAAVYTNRAFLEIMGTDPVKESRLDDAPATYRIFDCEGRVFPLDRVPFAVVVATGQATTSDQMVVHRADGRKVPIRAFAQPMRDAGGTLTHVIVAFLDITREIEAERERAAAQERLKMVVDHAPMAFFTLNRDGVVTLSEGAGLKALGVAPGQLVGQSVFDLYRDYPLIIENLRRGLAGESFWSPSEVGEVSFDSWFAPLRDGDGQITGLVGVSNDVSELQRLRANTVQNARIVAMGTLAASVAHEINNPLTYAVASSLELGRMLAELCQRMEANEGPAGLDEWRRLLDRMSALQKPIQSGVERIASITRELRTYTRPDDDARSLVDLAALVGSVLRLFSKQVESRARLVATLGATPALPANESRLVQVVTNLLLNAAQAFDDASHDAAILDRDQERRRQGLPDRGRQRARGPRRSARANLRAVRDDQGGGTGHGPWPVRVPEHRAGAGRADHRRGSPGRGRAVSGRAACPRGRPSLSRRRRPCGPRRPSLLPAARKRTCC